MDGTARHAFHGLSCPEQQQIDWELECCAEVNILKGSSREDMCNSVLSPTDAAMVSEDDLEEPEGVDTDGVVVGQGQDFILVWTKEGINSPLAKKYESMTNPPEPGKPVDMLMLGAERLGKRHCF